MDTLLYSLYTHSAVDQQQWSAQNILADSVKLCMYQNELIYSPNEELQLFVSTEKMIAGFVLRLPKNAHSLPHHLSQIFDTSDSYEKGYLFRKILVKPWIVRNIKDAHLVESFLADPLRPYIHSVLYTNRSYYNIDDIASYQE